MQVVTPRTVSVARTTVTIRNPWAVWILGFFTLGIYTVVWTYMATRELRDYSIGVTRPFTASPTVAALLVALWPLGFIPGIVGAFVMGRRVRKVETWVDSPHRVRAIVAALLFPLLFVHSLYLQRALNGAWELAERGRGPAPDEALASGQANALAAETRQDALRRDASSR